jgi:LPS sulfotransferase NodH
MDLIRRAKQKVWYLKNNWTPQLHDYARQLGLLEGHTGYTRFIILGRSRSGSNFLRGLLNTHPNIVAFEEMFKNPEQIGWGLEGYPQHGRALKLYQSDPIQFTEQYVFNRKPANIQAVGFKIFYYHAHQTPLAPIWDYLESREEIHVLHIKRQNILETHLSKKRAEKTGAWINLSGEQRQLPVIELDYEECLEDFEQTRRWETEYDRLFSTHPLLEIRYEDLARDYARIMPEIQQFLGVELQPVAPQTYRQSQQTLSAAIANYQELKARFTGSPWEPFFYE